MKHTWQVALSPVDTNSAFATRAAAHHTAVHPVLHAPKRPPAEDGYVEEGQLPLRHLPPPVVRHGLQQAGQQVRGALPHGVEDGQRAHQQGVAALGFVCWGHLPQFRGILAS